MKTLHYTTNMIPCEPRFFLRDAHQHERQETEKHPSSILPLDKTIYAVMLTSKCERESLMTACTSLYNKRRTLLCVVFFIAFVAFATDIIDLREELCILSSPYSSLESDISDGIINDLTTLPEPTFLLFSSGWKVKSNSSMLLIKGSPDIFNDVSIRRCSRQPTSSSRRSSRKVCLIRTCFYVA
jgi:hypothetical protein